MLLEEKEGNISFSNLKNFESECYLDNLFYCIMPLENTNVVVGTKKEFKLFGILHNNFLK